MAGETSYFERLRALLDAAWRMPSSNREVLRYRLLEDTPSNFLYHRWDNASGRRIAIRSESAIRRTLDLAIALNLVDAASGLLTDLGRLANSSMFSEIVGGQAEVLLGSHDLSLEELGRIAGQLLAGDPPQLPTIITLHEVACKNTGSRIDFQQFRILVQLLSASGRVLASKKHIYFLAPVIGSEN